VGVTGNDVTNRSRAGSWVGSRSSVDPKIVPGNVIAIVHWCLRVETHPCGNIVSVVITFCLPLGRHGSINSTSWSSRDMCVNWNEP